MNKKIVIPLLILFFIPATSDAYTERDMLQEWKDYLESYKDYMEKYKKWVENKFQIYEKNIHNLEKEVFELKQEIEHLEEEKSVIQTDDITQPQQEIKHQNVELPYITTDKQDYSLGDTVYVTGKLMGALTKQLINGTVIYPSQENINIIIITPENERKTIDGLGGCMGYYPYDETQYPVEINNWRDYETPIEFGKYYHHTIDKRTECNIHDGVFTGSFEITGDFTAGVHKISYTHQSSPIGSHSDRYLYSESFTIR